VLACLLALTVFVWMLVLNCNVRWLRLTDQDTVGDGVEIDTLVANLLCALSQPAACFCCRCRDFASDCAVLLRSYGHLTTTYRLCPARRTVDFEAVAALAGLPPAAAEQLPGLLRHALTLSRRAA
jgi:hypothetical protein